MISIPNFDPVAKAIGVTALMGLAACASKPREVRAPSLTYVADAACESDIRFDNIVTRSEEPKVQKREMRSRVIQLSEDMANSGVPCVTSVDGQDLPYQVFEIPTGMTGRVVSAGSMLASAVIFAGDIETYNSDGDLVRRFGDEDYRRLGSIYGVQFSPSAEEDYVLIIANPDLVGERDSTVETDTRMQNVTVAYGAAVSSGTNTIGVQRRFDRTYSYNGVVAVRTVFPKQEKEKE
jgi:hypothetical protein